MTLTSTDLLARLGSGVRPESASTNASSPPIDQAGFADLLDRVRHGAISSDRPVEIAPGAGVELNADQLRRLGIALDAAEAAGHHRVMALIDGQALAIDVPGRMVMEALSPADARLLSDFDAVMSVPAGSDKDLRSLFSAGGRGQAEQSPHAGLGTIRNQSLAELLSSVRPGDELNDTETAANEAA